LLYRVEDLAMDRLIAMRDTIVDNNIERDLALVDRIH